ncbi:bifunctional diguanylate cyclase/phosphodiesterase [Methylophilus aquaticus]|uniref:EAL domain-containing protein n=1 Tax=Methylophilus aquaticus TaxID=1971610 RepID=A0ABT9JY38_9PROT|nr:EAL domain-containing protein [Methylophilus aquaticus]MDP8568795.1 EAL domain-containing protein [Methylophilus aquaticus]
MFRLNIASLRQLMLSRWIVGLLLLSALQTTFMLWMNERQHAEALQSYKFRQAVQSADDSIQRQMDTYRQTLKSVEQLYVSSNHVSAEEFKLFVDDYTESPQDHGLRAIGFIKYIHLRQPQTYRDLDIPIPQLLKKVQPVAGDDELAPVLYVEPRTDANQERLLQNTFANPQLRADLRASSEPGRLVMSTQLAIEGDGLQRPQFMLQAPVYWGELLKADQFTRQHHLNGWVFLRFDVQVFLSGALHAVEQRQLHIDVFDITRGQPHIPLYHSVATQDNVHETRAMFAMTRTFSVNGQPWQMRVRSTPAFDATIDYSDANRIGMFGLFLSILAAGVVYFAVMRHRTQRELEKNSQELMTSEQRWKFALEGTGDGIWDWNVPENQVIYSDRWKGMLGFASHEFDCLPASWHQRIHAEDYASAISILEQVLKGKREKFALEYRLQCKDGSWKWVFDRGMVLLRDERGLPLRILGTLADITKIKQSEEAVWQYANVDTLTGLLNRRMFFARLDQELRKVKRSGQKLAIIFLDLDRFKEVNDMLGHAQGDKLLQHAGKRLVECVRDDDLVSRLGGDEFVLMLSAADVNYVEDVAQKVLDALVQPFRLDQSHVYVSASLGIAIFPDDADNKEDLMKRVDQAIYASKQKGGSCFTYFTPRMQEHAERRMLLSNDLRLAISKKQFFLEYQPVVNLQNNTVFKAEALIRWRHPEKGVIPPMEFIGIAEDNLLILQIGQWVFKTAIEQCRHWRESLHPAFQVAINKSPVQFVSEQKRQQDWFFKMAQNHLPGDMVTVEITERLLLDANPHVSERLAQYRRAGVQVALDDFGTGYSALSYLKKFPIDYVKIDRSFVRELGSSHEDGALCQAIIVMAHSLGMQVVAEGIENQRQLDMLREMGCDYGQGYYFSPPLRPAAFEAWHQAWNKSMQVS